MKPNSKRAEAVGEYWWVHPMDKKTGFTIPFRTVDPPNANRTTITPSISQLHLFNTAAQPIPPPQPPACDMVQIKHEPNPGTLHRYKPVPPKRPRQLAELGAGRGYGNKINAKTALRLRDRLPARKVEDQLEEMAVDDLMAGRMQLMPAQGGKGIVARQLQLPRVAPSAIWEKRQRSPVRREAIPRESTQQSLNTGQQLLSTHKLDTAHSTADPTNIRQSLVSLKDYLADVSSLKSPRPPSVLQFSPLVRPWVDPRLSRHGQNSEDLRASEPTFPIRRNQYIPPRRLAQSVAGSIGSPIDLRLSFEEGRDDKPQRPMTQEASRSPRSMDLPHRPASQPVHAGAARRLVSRYSPPFQPTVTELAAEDTASLTSSSMKIVPAQAAYNSTASGIMQEYSRRTAAAGTDQPN